MKLAKNKQETLLKQLKVTGIALAVAGMVAAPNALADNTASAFYDGEGGVIGAAALAGGTCDLDGYCKVFETVLENSGTPKDLVIGLSFETVLMTDTSVKSQGGNKSTSVADAKITMKVLVDGVEAAPGPVIFDRRRQELWAKLGGVLDCVDTVDPETGETDGIISFDECTLTDEEIGLILDTAQASTFNFLKYNIGSGSHTIEAWAQLEEGGEIVDGYGDFNSSAALGKGTLSVWEVHGAMSK